MPTKKIEFTNSSGHKIVAKLELPSTQEAHNFAIFAHCFTCNKNFNAVRNISKKLSDNGIAVLRIDFTGLGESEGDFEQSNFSSNVQDIIDASNYLSENYKKPNILIGHSLGGAAIIYAAEQLSNINALICIAAPSCAEHVQHLFSEKVDEIKHNNSAEVNIGGRKFNINQDFLNDIKGKSISKILGALRKAVLIFHSPQDSIVEIKNAEELYTAAHHPKSFISLNNANHLLSNSKDSVYVAEASAGWLQRYIETKDDNSIKSKHKIAVAVGADSYTCNIKVGSHNLLADEPEDVGGNNFGPSPFEYVTAGLGACTVMTLRMYADRKNWPLESAIVHLEHSKKDSDENNNKIDVFTREIQLFGPLDDKQKDRLIEIANKCPVHKTLANKAEINTSLLDN